VRQALPTALLLLAALGALVVGWRIVVVSMAATLAEAAPQQALAWNPSEPLALLARAQEQLDAGQLEAAAMTARDLLRAFPLQAQALVVLARVADAQHDPAAAARFAIALQRAPRDAYARAWMSGTQLQEGDYDQALANIDTLLTIMPSYQAALLPILVALADKPAFAMAMARALQHRPTWRGTYLGALLKDGSFDAADQIFGRLQDAHDLDRAEASSWLERLKQAGMWGAAYSRWVSGLELAPGASLALVHDGGFEERGTGIGFDWRMPGAPGVLVERVTLDGARVAQVSFLGRRVPQPNFAQTLFLAPGTYELQYRARARNLRSDRGIAWTITCRGDNPARTRSDALQGSFDWKTLRLRFEVPAQDCPAQELALSNPGAGGAGKIVVGTLWFDDIVITPVPAAEAGPVPGPEAANHDAE